MSPNTNQTVDPERRRTLDDNYELHQIKRSLLDARDAFGNLLTRRTFNNADLAAHYAYTPERYRFYRNGSRELLQYEDLSSYAYFDDKRSGEEDVFVLQPAAGDVLTFRTAERFRYTVNFVSEVTAAVALSQSLTNPDDRLTVALDTSPNRDLSDGYLFEQDASHAANEADLYEKRNGSVIGDPVPVTLPVDTQTFQRLELDYNWYNVGEENWLQTSTTESDGQQNVPLGTTSAEPGDANAGPGGRGPIAGNGHIVIEVEADSATSGLEVYAGSMSFTTLGAAGASVKGKGAETPELSVTQTTDWEPLGIAFRVDPARPNVATQIREIDITAGSGKVMFIACDPSNVLDGGGNPLSDSDFTTTARPDGRPVEHSGTNSAIQVTPPGTVAEIPSTDGTTGATQSNPGGYQLAFATTRSSGQGSKTATRSAGVEEKHGILHGDYAVPIAHPETTDPFRIEYALEFDE